jgi:hypothetical protein
MAVTFANIIVGEGTLYVSNNNVGSTAPGSISFTDVGGTQEGVMISWEPDMVDIEVDQFGDAARVIQSKVKVMVKTKMAETTFSNLALAWGYGGATDFGDTSQTDTTKTGVVTSGGTTTLNIGIHSALPEERAIKVTGPAPGATTVTPKTRTYICTRAVSVGSVEVAYKRNENSALPVEFRILPNASQTGKEYGTVVDA